MVQTVYHPFARESRKKSCENKQKTAPDFTTEIGGFSGYSSSYPCFFYLENAFFIFLAPGSIIADLRRFQLKLQFIGDEGDEFRVGGLALGIADGVSEEPLEGVEIFIALLVGLMPYDLLGYGYNTIESTKTQLFCICVILYI